MRVHVLSSAIVLLAACADKPTVPDGKSDVASRVDDRGELALGDPRTGMVVEDLELHGFHLTVAAGARGRDAGCNSRDAWVIAHARPSLRIDSR